MSVIARMRWFVVAICFGLFVSGCSVDSDKKNPVDPNGEGDTYPITVVFKRESTVVDLADLPVVMIDGAEAVSMLGLVDSTLVADPGNYVFRVVGADGFYAHQKGADDNVWNHIYQGYVILSTMRANFDPSLGLPGRYNVSNMARLEILRKIDFCYADTLIQYVVDDMTAVPFNEKTGVPMTDFIPADLITEPSSLAYDLVASDGYAKTANYTQVQAGFYVIEDDQVQYSDSSITGLRVKKINKIVAKTP
jgi:hypothetical protein